jgi:bacterioferritin (cytochrome b1)
VPGEERKMSENNVYIDSVEIDYVKSEVDRATRKYVKELKEAKGRTELGLLKSAFQDDVMKERMARFLESRKEMLEFLIRVLESRKDGGLLSSYLEWSEGEIGQVAGMLEHIEKIGKEKYVRVEVLVEK